MADFDAVLIDKDVYSSVSSFQAAAEATTAHATGSWGAGAQLYYTMRATLDGVSTVYWTEVGAPGTGNAPPGVLTDVGVEFYELR